jgi:hypothetical protein
MVTQKLISTKGEGSVPLPLGLAATYCILADAFGGLKGRGRRYGIRHAGRVSVEY